MINYFLQRSEGVKAIAVRQVQVQKDDINRLFIQKFHAV